jgi:hypothetical protein
MDADKKGQGLEAAGLRLEVHQEKRPQLASDVSHFGTLALAALALWHFFIPRGEERAGLRCQLIRRRHGYGGHVHALT